MMNQEYCGRIVLLCGQAESALVRGDCDAALMCMAELFDHMLKHGATVEGRRQWPPPDEAELRVMKRNLRPILEAIEQSLGPITVLQ
jgi:hypothetical protein